MNWKISNNFIFKDTNVLSRCKSYFMALPRNVKKRKMETLRESGRIFTTRIDKPYMSCKINNNKNKWKSQRRACDKWHRGLRKQWDANITFTRIKTTMLKLYYEIQNARETMELCIILWILNDFNEWIIVYTPDEYTFVYSKYSELSIDYQYYEKNKYNFERLISTGLRLISMVLKYSFIRLVFLYNVFSLGKYYQLNNNDLVLLSNDYVCITFHFKD